MRTKLPLLLLLMLLTILASACGETEDVTVYSATIHKLADFGQADGIECESGSVYELGEYKDGIVYKKVHASPPSIRSSPPDAFLSTTSAR